MDRNKEILTGIEVVDKSSPAAIAENVRRLKRQIGGLPDPEVIVDGKIVTSISALETAGDHLELTSQESKKVFADDSINQIFEIRTQKLVAKNTHDEEALEEIKKAA